MGIREALQIVLDELKKDRPSFVPRLEAAIDVMGILSDYEHLAVLKAVFHVAPPLKPKESGEEDGA